MSRLATRALGVAAVALLALTVVLGLSLPESAEQDAYSRLIAIHPPLAWTAYLAFGVTALASLGYLVRRSRVWDQVAGASGELAVVFTALMLVTGSIWGRPTWGVWWVWDARLTLSALMLALLLGYVALRRVQMETSRRSTICAIAALSSVLVVPVNHFAVTWWRTLHQDRSLARIAPQSKLDGEFIVAMLVGFLAMTLVYGWLLVLRVAVERLEEELEEDSLERAIAQRRAEAGVPA